MPYNKGTLDAYRKVVAKEFEGRNLTLTGSITAGGVISGSSYQGLTGGGDMLKSVYDTNNDGTVGDSDKLEGSTRAQVQTHAPASHASSHTSGSGDDVTIYKNQISDIDGYVVTGPRLSVTGSDISSISGSLIVTGSISGSSYDGSLVTSVKYSGSAALTKAITFTGSGGTVLSQSGQIITISGSELGISAFSKSGSTELTGKVYVTGSTSGLLISQSGQLLDFTLHTTLTPTNLIATNVTGSGIVSGANIYGASATITDINATNITATNVTGSTLLSGSTIRGFSGIITHITSTNITGSTISGSTYQGGLITGFGKSGSTLQTGNYMLQEGTGVTLTESESGSYHFLEVIAATGSGAGTPSNTVVSENAYNVAADKGTASTYSRGDHTHGTPGISAASPSDIGSSAATGSSTSGSSGGHVHRGVGSISRSGSSELYGKTYLTGSGTVDLSQTGQIISISGSTGPTFDSVTASHITGSLTLSGSNVRTTNLTTQNIIVRAGGSVLIDDSSYIDGGRIQNCNIISDVSTEYITGSVLISGSTIKGKDATITNINTSNITGSTLISGSSIKGTNATITNITGSELSISGNAYITGTISPGSYENLPGDTGTATITAGNTYVDVSHDLGEVPAGSIDVTPFSDTRWWIPEANIGSGTFRIQIPIALDNDVKFRWSVGGVSVGGLCGVTSLSASGSTTLENNIYLTGSGNVTLTQNGQIITIQGDCPVGVSGSYSLTSNTSEQTMLELTPSVITRLYNIYFDMTPITGSTGTLKVYSKIDNSNYREMRDFRKSVPTVTEGIVMKEVWVDTDFKITFTCGSAEGATRTIYYRYFKEEY